jgi:hypothetical protein
LSLRPSSSSSCCNVGIKVAAVFNQLAERYLLVDPSGGTCCRNVCAGCQFVLEEPGEVRS